MRKILLLGAVLTLLLSAGQQAFAKSRPIITKCGKVYYIYAEMFTPDEIQKLIDELNRIDCGGSDIGIN